MRRFYKQSLWIPQNFLLTNPDLHHGLLSELTLNVRLYRHPNPSLLEFSLAWVALPPLAWEPVPKPEAMQAKQSAD
jgi:hypothetical protein